MAHASEEKPLVADRPVSHSLAIPAAAQARGPIFDFLDGAFQGLINRRQQKWNQRVAETIADIRSRTGETGAGEILASEHFLTVVTEATLIACRNHDEEKIKALRAAILHTALSDAPDEPIQMMFLRLIDYLTPLHLVTVAFLNDPVEWMKQHDMPDPRWPVGTSSALIQYCVVPVQGKPGIVEMIVRDLQGAGLVEQGHFLRMPMSGAGILQSHTTDCGRLFVRYISET